MANLEQTTEHIDDMQNLNSLNPNKVALDNASWMAYEASKNEKRKVLSTEPYTDEYGRSMIKKVYEDNSRSIELAGGYIRYDYDEERDYSKYDYTEFYPNGIKKFECSAAPYEWSLYAIYDENWKVLYYELFEWLRENDSANEDEDFKYDGKGRLIQDDIHGYEYKYDDANKKVVEIEKFYINWKNVVKHVITYKMDKYGEADYDNVLSHIFIGETGVELDLMNWWVEKLIEEKHLENTPYIDRYKF